VSTSEMVLQRMLEYWIDNNTGKQTSKVTCSQYNANEFWQLTALFYSWLWNKAKENFKENIQSLQTSLTKKALKKRRKNRCEHLHKRHSTYDNTKKSSQSKKTLF